MLRGQIVNIAVGSVFVVVGFACWSIAAIRRRTRVHIFVWLGFWSAMYGALQLSQSPAVIMALPRALQSGAPSVNTAIGYLIVVPALLAFLELTSADSVSSFKRPPGLDSLLASPEPLYSL